MCGRFTASFEFREIKLRWNLQRDLPNFYAALQHRAVATGAGDCKGRTGNRFRAGSPLLDWQRHSTT